MKKWIWARSIQPNFLGISVQNSMDWFGPTGKVSEKRVHLLMWSSFPGRTGWNFGWMDRALCFLANQLDWTPKQTVNSDSECFKSSFHGVRGGVLHDNIKNGYVFFLGWFWSKNLEFFVFHFWLKKDMKINNVWWCSRQKAGLSRWQKYPPYIGKKLNFSQGVSPRSWSKIWIFFFRVTLA